MKCPRCWADKAYLHTYHNWREMFLGCLAFRPMKCTHCYHRFMVHWVFTIGEQIVPPVLHVTRHEASRAERNRPPRQDHRPNRAA